MAFVLDQAVELVADLLDDLLGHDLGIDETDDRDPIDVFQAEMTARRRLATSGNSCPDLGRASPSMRRFRPKPHGRPAKAALSRVADFCVSDTLH